MIASFTNGLMIETTKVNRQVHLRLLDNRYLFDENQHN